MTKEIDVLRDMYNRKIENVTSSKSASILEKELSVKVGQAKRKLYARLYEPLVRKAWDKDNLRHELGFAAKKYRQTDSQYV